MLRNNAFPDIRIDGDASNAYIPQPVSKQHLLNGLQNLQMKANALKQKIEMGQGDGKSLHPGLGYFSANEWCQFASMHLWHHRRQKQRIDAFLSTLPNGTEDLFAHDAT